MSKYFMTAAFCLFSLISIDKSYACEEYKKIPGLLNEEEFMSLPDIGTIALKPYPDRGLYLAFTETGCYDLTEKYSFSPPYKFFLDSSGEEERVTYISASVSRKFSYRMKDVPSLSLELFRNDSKDNVAASWAKALVDEESFLDGSAISGRDFAIFDDVFESQNPIDLGAQNDISDLDLISAPEEASFWHALIVDVQGIPNRDAPYRVLKNTRRAAGYLRKGIYSGSGGGTVLNKMYLVKFRSVPGQLVQDPVLKVGQSGCLYISYQIDGSGNIPIKMTGATDNLVFRLDHKVDC